MLNVMHVLAPVVVGHEPHRHAKRVVLDAVDAQRGLLQVAAPGRDVDAQVAAALQRSAVDLQVVQVAVPEVGVALADVGVGARR